MAQQQHNSRNTASVSQIPLTGLSLTGQYLRYNCNVMAMQWRTWHILTSHWMWSTEKICIMHCFSTLSIIWVLKRVSPHYSLKSITVHSAINFLTWFIQLVPDVFPHYIKSVLSRITSICKSKKKKTGCSPSSTSLTRTSSVILTYPYTTWQRPWYFYRLWHWSNICDNFFNNGRKVTQHAVLTSATVNIMLSCCLHCARSHLKQYD